MYSVDGARVPSSEFVSIQERSQRAESCGRVRPALATAMFFSLFLSLSQLVIPLFSMQIFDRVLPSASLPTLVALGIITICIVTISAVIDSSRSVLLTRLGNVIYYHHYEALAKGLTADTRTAIGLLHDLESMRAFVAGPLATTLLDLPCSLAFLIAIFFLHPLLGYFTLVSASIMFGLGVATHSVNKKERHAALETVAESSQLLVNLAHPTRFSGTMGLRQRSLTHLRNLHEEYLGLTNSANERQAHVEAISRGAKSFIQVLMLTCAAFLVVSQSARVGSIVAASMLLSRSLYPIERLASAFPSIMMFLAAKRRIEVYRKLHTSCLSSFDLPVLTGAIEIKNVSFHPNSQVRPVLRGITLSVAAGCVLAVVGREGAGKSTLSKLIVGLETPSIGEIRFDGSKISDFDPVTLGDQIGFLPEMLWFDERTVSSFICRGRLNADPTEIIRAAQRFDVHSTIQKLPNGYLTSLSPGKPVLSSGHLQRLALARAFFGDPKIIVLDEPTLHLDDRGEALLLDAISASKKAGTTFIVISRLPGLLHLADQLLMLDEGIVRLLADQSQMQNFLTPRLATSQLA